MSITFSWISYVLTVSFCSLRMSRQTALLKPVCRGMPATYDGPEGNESRLLWVLFWNFTHLKNNTKEVKEKEERNSSINIAEMSENKRNWLVSRRRWWSGNWRLSHLLFTIMLDCAMFDSQMETEGLRSPVPKSTVEFRFLLWFINLFVKNVFYIK